MLWGVGEAESFGERSKYNTIERVIGMLNATLNTL